MRRWSPGEPLVLRELWRGEVFAARPAIVVEDAPTQLSLLVPGGVRCGVAVDEHATELRVPDRPWRLEVRERGPDDVLSFAWPDTPYAVFRWWTSSVQWTWYVNLQDPLRRTELGFDTTDHALDATVLPDGTWYWKDEDELAAAVANGLFSPADADRFRADGKRAIDRIRRHEPPFDRDWTSWQPDPAWPTPGLPEGWDRP